MHKIQLRHVLSWLPVLAPFNTLLPAVMCTDPEHSLVVGESETEPGSNMPFYKQQHVGKSCAQNSMEIHTIFGASPSFDSLVQRSLARSNVHRL